VTWTTVSSITVTMTNSLTAGLAVCSHDNTALNTSTFDHAAITAKDFTLSVNPGTATVTAGSNAAFSVAISVTNGFNSAVQFSATGLPAGATANFTPSIVIGPGSWPLSVATSNTTPPGNYPLTITAASGSLVHTAAVTLIIPADSDGDGIPDAWMWQYFGHPTGQAIDKSRAADDADNDGMSNLAEFLAGTNPTNAASNLRLLSASNPGNGTRLTWTVVGGKSYVVQTAATLGAANSFTDLSPVIPALGSGESVTNFLDAATNAPTRFYRIRLGP
jgi:hypothetical protein